MESLLEIARISSPIIIALGLMVTLHNYRISRTIAYIERLNKPDMVKVRTTIDSWLESTSSNSAKIEIYNSDSNLRANLTILMNILSELAISYRYGLLNPKITFEIWHPIISGYRKKLDFMIKNQEANGNAQWQSFQIIAEDITKYNDLKSKPFFLRKFLQWQLLISRSFHTKTAKN